LQANFTPGPSQLYFTVKDHIKRAFRDGIPSLSHRSKEFESIFGSTSSRLKELLGIPDNFSIVYTSSATEIWERSIQSMVEQSSLHLVNGAFSKRYFEVAQQLMKVPVKFEVPEGHGFDSLERDGIMKRVPVFHFRSRSYILSAKNIQAHLLWSTRYRPFPTPTLIST
jgi:phosphoserine aminotransferase